MGALTAEELRRDGLIAPSGCGQDRKGGDKGRGYSSRRAYSSLPAVVIGPDVVQEPYIHEEK